MNSNCVGASECLNVCWDCENSVLVYVFVENLWDEWRKCWVKIW